MVSVMLYPCILCVALLIYLFLLCVVCLTGFVNCLDQGLEVWGGVMSV